MNATKDEDDEPDETREHEAVLSIELEALLRNIIVWLRTRNARNECRSLPSRVLDNDPF